MKRAVYCVSFLFGLALLASIADATPHEFFKGKTIKLVVGTSVGGAMDEWGRFIAPHPVLTANGTHGNTSILQVLFTLGDREFAEMKNRCG